MSAESFDSDRCAQELLARDAEVRRQIGVRFGNSIFATNGELDRVTLRKIVFDDETKRRDLEAILHPIIRARWTFLAKKAVNEKDWLMVDIPLLFETKAESHFTAIAVVACSVETQRQRLLAARRLSKEIADKMIASQLPLPTKIERADHLIWNDGPAELLEQQAALLAAGLSKRYG